MRLFEHNHPFRSSRLPLLFFACLCISIFLALISCGKGDPVEDGWEQRLSELEPDFSLSCLDDWTTIERTYRRGIISLHLEQLHEDDKIKLVVTIIPVTYNRDELIAESLKLLEASLFHLQSIGPEEWVEIEGNEVVFLNAVAGEKETICVRMACFSKGGRSYFYTVLAGDDSFSKAVEELDLIIYCIDFK